MKKIYGALMVIAFMGMGFVGCVKQSDNVFMAFEKNNNVIKLKSEKGMGQVKFYFSDPWTATAPKDDWCVVTPLQGAPREPGKIDSVWMTATVSTDNLDDKPRGSKVTITSGGLNVDLLVIQAAPVQ